MPRLAPDRAVPGLPCALSAALPAACSYMSPEVFVHNDISPQLDIYSLGIIREWPFSCRGTACGARCNTPARQLGGMPHASVASQRGNWAAHCQANGPVLNQDGAVQH